MIEINSASATGVFRSSVTDIFWILNWGLEPDNTPLKKQQRLLIYQHLKTIFFG